MELETERSLTFQEQIIKTLQTGDLNQFKQIFISKQEINRKLLPFQILSAAPIINKDENYICPKGPTMLMYAIICEQSDIVEYILNTMNPDLSLRSSGFNALHLAAMIKEPKPLQLLLQRSFYQDHVDDGVDFDTLNTDLGYTSALHIAVTNHRYLNVYHLLSPFKRPIDIPNWVERRPNIHANIDQIAASGSSALHIAVYLHDINMVKLLLSFKANIYLTNKFMKTALQMAEEDNHPVSKKIIQLLNDHDTFESYSPARIMYDIYPENPEFAFAAPKKQAEPVITNAMIFNTLNEVLRKLADLESRVTMLEITVKEGEAKLQEENAHNFQCCKCGNPGILCPNCQEYYCESCISKSQLHHCI